MSKTLHCNTISAETTPFSLKFLGLEGMQMMLGRLITSILNSATHLRTQNLLATCWFSSTTAPTAASAIEIFARPGKPSLSQLYRRIFPVKDPNVSIVPILDQWIKEEQSVDKEGLTDIIKGLRSYKRYAHALEISTWMTDKRHFLITPADVAIRLDLISKAHGIEEADNYFNNISVKLKTFKVYGALLNCYVHARSVEKAEEVMQKMRDLGFDKGTVTYTGMLNLYYQTGNIEKLNGLMQEMDENGIGLDKFAYGIRLSACAAAFNIGEMEKTIAKMESDPKVVLDWPAYSAAAVACRKAGLLDKALEMLKKSEGLIPYTQKAKAYLHLMTQYAAIGKKDDVLRILELYRKNVKDYKGGYGVIMSSLLKLGEFESAENIFAEWESQNLNYDIRIPNTLFRAYATNGLANNAEILLDRLISKGWKPNARTWYFLATAYLQNNQTDKAVEMIKKSVELLDPKRWKPGNECLASCLEYLKGQGDMDKVEEFLNLLRDKDVSLD